MTMADHPEVQTLDDLAGQPVCTLATSTALDPLAEAGADRVSRRGILECVEALRAGEVTAIETDAAILAGYARAEPDTFLLHDIGLDTQEAYGINTGGNLALRDLVNLALYASLHDPADERWEEAFETYLMPASLPAAGGEPQQVAVGEQPDVAAVDVRQWPWERDW